MSAFAGLLLVSAGGALARQGQQGGYSPVAVSDENVVAAAQFAVSAEEKRLQNQTRGGSVKLELLEISRAEQQVVSGMNYRMTLKLRLNGDLRQARVVVWWQAWRQPDPYRLSGWRWERLRRP